MKKFMALAVAAMMVVCSMAAFAAEEAENTEENTVISEETEVITETENTAEDTESTEAEGTEEETTKAEGTETEGTEAEGTDTEGTEAETQQPAESVIVLQINNNIMFKDDTQIELDVPAQLINDRTLVPMRAIFEALDAVVTWDDATQTAIGEKDGVVIKITIDSNIMYVGEEAVEIDVPAQLVNDRTLVPVRAISEAFGSQVTWDEASETVIIKSTVAAEEGNEESVTEEEATEGTVEGETTEEVTEETTEEVNEESTEEETTEESTEEVTEEETTEEVTEEVTDAE